MKDSGTGSLLVFNEKPAFLDPAILIRYVPVDIRALKQFETTCADVNFIVPPIPRITKATDNHIAVA